MVGRACDACRKRKIKCVGAGLSCRNCSSAGLSCTFHATPMKKGPKGQNASVLHELRQAKKRCPLPPEQMRDCIDAFYTKLYLVMPIIDREQFLNSLNFETMSPERFCLLTALCSLTNLQVLNRPADELIRETLRTRQSFDYVECPTLDCVHISFFLFACFFGLNVHNTAWFYLREAITFAQLLGLDNEESYANIQSPLEAAYKRRTFWVLFVTERAYAIQRHHSLSMSPSIDVPSIDSIDGSEDLAGFNYMVNLWSTIDLDFVTIWNDKRYPVDAEWMSRMHGRLCSILPPQLSISEVQQADILISQQWLRTILWQLSTSRMLLSSNAQDESLRFSFPITISRDLLRITGRMTPETLEVHGIGICEKVFEVASTLVDVMVCDPMLRDPAIASEASRNLEEMLRLLATLRSGTSPWYQILVAKVSSSLPGLFPNHHRTHSSNNNNLNASSVSLSPRSMYNKSESLESSPSMPSAQSLYSPPPTKCSPPTNILPHPPPPTTHSPLAMDLIDGMTMCQETMSPSSNSNATIGSWHSHT